MRRSGALIALLTATAGCSTVGDFTAVYPPRPPATPGAPVADPVPSRVVVHTTVTGAALRQAIEEALPQSGDGTFPLAGSERRYTWRRAPVAVRFDQGRIGLDVHVDGTADLPLTSLDFPIELKILAEPVVTSEYVAKLQSIQVEVQTSDKLLKLADFGAGVLGKIRQALEEKLHAFEHDLRPMLYEGYQRLATPIDLPLGDAQGCAQLKLVGVEAGPTVLAEGVEKDLAFVIAPSVTLPCDAPAELPDPPPLANVATVQPGPFTVTVPIAARYDELAKAMSLVFTNGRFYFSKEHPKLYMEKPEVYASKDKLILKVRITGPIERFGFETTLDGDLFLAGTPTVIDNELRIPDLEPTIETRSLLLQLKQALDGDSIRDQAREALRLDIGERLRSVREKLSTNLQFGSGAGCVRAQAHKIEVTGVHAHASYLRVYVTATAQASVYVPCPE